MLSADRTSQSAWRDKNVPQALAGRIFTSKAGSVTHCFSKFLSPAEKAFQDTRCTITILTGAKQTVYNFLEQSVLLIDHRIMSIHKTLPPESLSDDQTPCTTWDSLKNFPSSSRFSLEGGAKWLRFAKWTYFCMFFTCKIFISHITYIHYVHYLHLIREGYLFTKYTI